MYLGRLPVDGCASAETAKQLAAAAFTRAENCAGPERHQTERIGISVTAVMPTSTETSGNDRIHVALHQASGGQVWSADLGKNAFTRQEAESVADEMVRRALASAAGRTDEDDTDLPDRISFDRESYAIEPTRRQ